LALERTDEPFENTAGPIFCCIALCYFGKELWTLTPVCYGPNKRDMVSIKHKDVPNRLGGTGKLCEGNGGEDEGRGGERGEIAREVCNPTERIRRLRRGGECGAHDLMN
jgi:hypothetical protein